MKKKRTLNPATYARGFKKWIESNFGSYQDAAIALGKHPTQIGECCTGKRNDRIIADKMGYRVETRIFYVPIEDEDQCF